MSNKISASEYMGYDKYIRDEYIVKKNPNMIEIPENATNGEALKALFPNIQVEHAEVNGIVEIECPDGDGLPWLVDEWWWNAPYKGD